MATGRKRYRPKPPPKVKGKGPVKSGETYGKHLDSVAAKRTAAAKALAAEKRERRSKLLAAASDVAGDMAERHKGGTHTPSGSGGVKSGASHNAKFLEVWHSGYKLDEPNM